MVGALKQYLSQNDGIDALTLVRPAMHRKWRSSDRNYPWEISPQPLCRKRLGKMGLLQGWCSHDQHRQEENQIRRLVWSAYRDNGSSNRRKEESVGCKQDLPEGKKLQALQSARSNAQRCARRCANEYWLDLCACIQSGVKTSIIKAVYVRWNQAGTWSFSEQNSSLKTASGGIIQDRVQQMKRWIEHYSELYTRDWDNGVWGSQRRHRVQTCCGGPGQWTNWRGSEKGPGFTSTWESAGQDSIRAEILKCCKGVAFNKLYQILCLCWREGKYQKTRETQT